MTKKKAESKKSVSPKDRHAQRLCALRNVLIKANNLLTKETWVTGYERGFRQADGTHTHMCAVGSVREALDREKLPKSYYMPVVKRLNEVVGARHFNSIVEFNDAAAAGVGSVKRKFTQAIKNIEAEIADLS